MKKLWPPIALWLALLTPALALLTADRWLPMTWRAPGQFGWLTLLPMLALFYVWALRRRERVMALFVEARLLPDLASGIAPGWQWLRMGLVLLAFTAVVMALARPRWGSETIKTSQGNLDVVLAIDTSKSMLAGDLKPNRLERTKLAAKELKRIAPTDRFAVMPFAGAAFLQCPLTSEEGIFRQNIEAVRVGSIPLEGTSLARLIETAAKAFVDEPTRQKVLVIFTDGEDHEGEAIEAAKLAKGDGLKIFTIGVGSVAGDVIAVRRCLACATHNPADRANCLTCNAHLPDTDYLRDENGDLVQSRLNETLLREIAKAAGGFYLPLRGTQAMATLHKNGLAPLAKSVDTGTVEKEIAREQYRWPLGAAVLLLLTEVFVPTRRRKGSTAAAALAALFLFTPDTHAAWLGLDKLFGKKERTEVKEPVIDDEDPHAHLLHYNFGVDKYRDKKYHDAIEHFTEALNAEDLGLQQRSFYNLGNAHFHLGKSEADNKKRIALWEDAAAHFVAACMLDARDGDAAANLRYVRAQLKREKDKLDKLNTRIPLGEINRLKQQDQVALAIFPPTPESMPEEPYWRMLVLDEYAHGVGSTSATLLAASSRQLRGTHRSDFGGRAPPADEKMPGEWRFHFEPLISKYLPMPGPFERVILPTRRAFRYNEPTLFARLDELPAKQVRYRVMFPANTRRIAPSTLDEPLLTGTPTDLKTYPGTTLALHLTSDERTALESVRKHVTGNRPLSAESFTEAAIKFLHENHAYTRDSRITPNSRNGDPVLRWLRSDTPGHCEYFAYSFQMIARASGHPTRVIGGLAGAEFSQKEKRHVAKLSDLHAWCEIFDGAKWVRVDPTPPEENPQQGDGDGQPQQQPNNNHGQANGQQPEGQQSPDQDPQLDNSGEEDLINDGGDGDESKLTPAEARELLEASRDQEKPLIFSPDPNQLTNQRMPEIRRRKNW
jgi:Ca-activated chloride channel family protein